MLLRADVLSYVIVTGMNPGKSTLHIRCIVSLFESMEQLYDIVSPGQLISDLDIFRSEGIRETDAVITKQSIKK